MTHPAAIQASPRRSTVSSRSRRVIRTESAAYAEAQVQPTRAMIERALLSAGARSYAAPMTTKDASAPTAIRKPRECRSAHPVKGVTWPRYLPRAGYGRGHYLPRVSTPDPDRWGWRNAPEKSLMEWPRWAEFAARAKADGLTHTVVCGMGGSSLAPWVLASSFGARDLMVLDSTDPAAVRAVERWSDPAHTLY